jgi:hypothetical protein
MHTTGLISCVQSTHKDTYTHTYTQIHVQKYIYTHIHTRSYARAEWAGNTQVYLENTFDSEGNQRISRGQRSFTRHIVLAQNAATSAWTRSLGGALGGTIGRRLGSCGECVCVFVRALYVCVHYIYTRHL